MAIKNKNTKSISRKKSEVKEQPVVISEPSVVEETKQEIVKEQPVMISEPSVVEETKQEILNELPVVSSPVVDTLQIEMLSLKKALLSVYNKLHVYVSKNYINYLNNNFTEDDNLLGFKNKKENITIKAELLDNNGELYKSENLSVNIKKNNENFNEYVLLEKTTLNNSRVVFQTTQTDSCVFQITFILTLENNETIEYTKEINYIACNKVELGYIDRHTKQYKIIKTPDITPSLTCKGNVYELKLYNLPLTSNNHGERIALFIPEDIYLNDGGDYSFFYNNFEMPLFYENKIKLNNVTYCVFLSTSYYENNNNSLYDFSIKIKVL